MKKTIISTLLLLALSITASAKERNVSMEFHRKNNPPSTGSVDRAPMRIPIDVTCDTDTRTIEIVGDEAIEAEAYLYTSTGDIADYSASVNTVFSVANPDIYVILIQGDSWYATGEVEM
ncbi:MAG: hypothetical protein K2H60_12030 [Muribaculaceae bacterium]|nr:hypothetical protein [Muribaculaceae bacterium]